MSRESIGVTIAKAVATELNAGGFELTFSARWMELPEVTDEECRTLQVITTDNGWQISAGSRGKRLFDYLIDIGFYKQVGNEQSEVEQLKQLAEDMLAYLSMRRLDNYKEAAFISSEAISHKGDPEHLSSLRESRIFRWVNRAVYRVYR